MGEISDSPPTAAGAPEISVNYLTRAIRFASDVGAPIVNTDEGIVPTG